MVNSHRIYRTVVYTVLWIFLLSGYAYASIGSEIVTKADKTLIVLRNAQLELVFDPSRGGSCSSFRFRDTGEDIIPPGSLGMFLDHWANHTPSRLMQLPYEYTLVGDGKTKVGIKLWIKVPEMDGGAISAYQQGSSSPTPPDVMGLIVRKTIWLREDSDLILVEQEMENTSDQSKSIAMHVQHHCDLGGTRYSNTWYLPSSSGIDYNIQPDEPNGRAMGADLITNPVAGWMAVRNGKTGRGLLFAFDYNYLQKINTSGSTAEWFLDPVPVMPGKSFKTEYVIKPLSGFEDFVHGSERLVADIRPEEVDGRVRVYHDIAAVGNDLTGLNVDFTVVNHKTRKQIAEITKHIGHLRHDKQRHEFEFMPSWLPDGVVIQARVRGQDFEERYEYYYAGDKEEYERRYSAWRWKGQALPATVGTAYYRNPPKKIKSIGKPDFTKVARPAPDKFRVLVVFGLYTHILNIDDALIDWQFMDKGTARIDWANCPPNAVQDFPGTYDDMFIYDTIVLSNVNYRAIGDIGVEMLCDYVEQGGNLLVVGGPYAYGNGSWLDSRFAQVLPVFLSGPFDLKWAGKGKSWQLSPAVASHDILKGVSFSESPRVFWQHFVDPKQDAEVILKAGDRPVLVLGRYGNGRIAVLTLSPTGVGKDDETQWWDWSGWFPLVRNTFDWLNKR